MPNFIITDSQAQTLVNEGLDTVKVGTDLLQYAGTRIMENPVKAAGIIALFSLALGLVKSFKLSDIIDIKKG
jgi:hypothetical protein